MSGEEAPQQFNPDESSETHIPLEQTNTDTGVITGPTPEPDPGIYTSTGNPKPREEEPSTRIEDEEKARVMAKAGHDKRSQGAYYRGLAREYEQGFRDVSPSDRRAFERGAKSDIRRATKGWDEAAKIQEKWAGVLYEHPVDTKYTEAHPKIDFTPGGLTLLEKHVAKEEERATRNHDRRAEEYDSPLFGSEVLPKELGKSTPFHEVVSKVDDPRLKELLDNDGTSIGQLREYLKERLQEDVEAHRTAMEPLIRVLDDVSAGRTAENQDSEEQHQD